VDRVSASLNLSQVLADEASARVALVEMSDGQERVFTFVQLAQMVNAVARGLRKRFSSADFRVGIVAENCVEFVALYLGAMRAGGVAVPASWKLSPDTLNHVLDDAAVDIVFHDERLTAPTDVPKVLIGSSDWTDFLDPGPFDAVSVTPDDVAQILYTSGSTGRPKGVPLTHAGQLWAVKRAASFVPNGSSYRVLIAAPMFHMNALFNLKRSLFLGSSIVLLPQFNARQYARAIELFRSDWLTCVPTMMAMLAREIGTRPPPEFAAVRRIFMSSSSFSPRLLETVQTMFPNAAILNSYGTTEAGPHVFEPHPAGLACPPMSCGYPTSDHMTRLVGDDGVILEGVGEGVLEMRTPATMSGYLNLPTLTAEVLHDGWYNSRDVMRRDENGFLYFVGRSDDMFTCGGENIFPIEVEQVLQKHPHVEQCFVVPVPDEMKQSIPFAFVVPRSDARPDEVEMRGWFLEQAPAYMHPRRIAFISEVPLGQTNKVDRAKLSHLAREMAGRSPDDPAWKLSR
jgi:long-chain acyl-CoA synthetase